MRNINKYIIDKITKRIGLNIILFVIALISIAPLYWLIIATFTPESEMFHYPPRIFIINATLENISTILRESAFFRSLFYSLAVSLSFVSLSLFFCSIAGYTFAKFNFPFKRILFFIVLSTYAMPFAIQLIPLFIIMVKINLSNNLLALFIPWVANAFGIFWLRQNLISFSDDMLDAARIDGLSEITVFFRIVLPNIRPALFSLGIIQFIFMYNDFLWPLIIIHEDKMYTLPLLLASIRNKLRLMPQWGELIAGCFLATLPIVIVFVLFQKNLIRGILGGAIKE